MSSQLLQIAREEIKNLYLNKISKDYVYHSFDHTLEVLTNSQEIGRRSGLPEDELESAAMAALFHDAGHVYGHQNHENASAEMVAEFLTKHQFPEQKINRIQDAIRATRVPQSPKTLLAKVLCDADLMYLSGKDFMSQANQLRIEWKLTGQRDIGVTRFFEISLQFFEEHSYHTAYGKQILTPLKEENRQLIKKLLSTTG